MLLCNVSFLLFSPKHSLTLHKPYGSSFVPCLRLCVGVGVCVSPFAISSLRYTFCILYVCVCVPNIIAIFIRMHVDVDVDVKYSCSQWRILHTSIKLKCYGLPFYPFICLATFSICLSSIPVSLPSLPHSNIIIMHRPLVLFNGVCIKWAGLFFISCSFTIKGNHTHTNYTYLQNMWTWIRNISSINNNRGGKKRNRK